MKAVVIYEPGSADKLIYQDYPTPKIKPGWSLIKIMGFGINHSEIFTRQGLSPNVKFPRILGIECVGIIVETTDHKLSPGQKIISLMGEMGREFDGSYAEYVLLPNEQIYPVKTDLDWPTLATIPETYFTAYGSLKNLQIRSNDTLLIRGATSGVGISALNLIKGRFPNLKVIASSRNLNKEKALLALGFDQVIQDKNNQLQTKQEFTKILDLIGPIAINDSFAHLKAGGIICSTGQLGGKWYLENFDPIINIKANSYLTSFYSGNVSQELINELLTYIEDNKIKINPQKIYRLAQIKEAHQYLESTDSLGKVIILNT